MMPPPTAQPVTTIVAVRLFACPYCGCGVTSSMRRPYPSAVVGCYAPVYQCRTCRKFIGAPVAGKEE